MITNIIVGGTSLKLFTNTFSWLQDRNQLFNYESVPAKWILPFSIPYKENATTFNYPADPTVIDYQDEYECFVELSNSWLIKGTLTIVTSDTNRIEVSITAPYYDMSETLFNTSIKSLNWSDFYLLADRAQIIIDVIFTDVSAVVDTIDFNSSYANYTHSRILGEPLVNVLGAFVDAVTLDEDASGISAEIIGGNILRLKQVEETALNHVFTTPNILVTSLTSSVTWTYDFTTWLIDHHELLRVSLDDIAESGEIYPDRTVCFPTIWNPGHYEDLNPEFKGWINHYYINQYFLNITSGQAWSSNKYTLVPYIFAMQVIEQIFTDAGITIIGELATDERLCRIIIENNYSIGKEFFDPNDDIEYISFSEIVHIPNHLPEMTVGEYLTGWRKRFNIFFHFDPLLRTIEFLFRDDVLTNPIRKDWNAKPFKPHPLFESIAPKGVTLSSPLDSSDSENGVHYTPYDTTLLQTASHVIGDGELDISSSFGTVDVARKFVIPHADPIPFTDPISAKRKVPVKYQAGSGEEFGGRFNSFSPRFLIYKGLQEDENTEDYCYATNDHLDSNDLPDDILVSLVWSKAYEFNFVYWLTFLVNSSVMRITLSLEIKDLMNLDFASFHGLQLCDWLIESYQIKDISGFTIYVEFVCHRQKTITI